VYSCGPNVPWRDVLIEDARAYVNRVFAKALGGVPGGVAMEIDVREGGPGRVLVTAADRCTDLLVIGGSGARRLSGWRRAAVARHCSRVASCPVVIVPPPDLARDKTVARMARDTVHEADRYLATPSRRPVSLPPADGRTSGEGT
jgi:hypothetical protein